MIFFTRIDPAKNIRRFWLAMVSKSLFGEWTLWREWGRSGSPGRVRLTSFESEDEARKAEQRAIMRRLRHGYSEKQ